MVVRLIGSSLVFTIVSGSVAAEPRELCLTDGTVVGAIAVGAPPEWTPDPERPDELAALVQHDGPWTAGSMPHDAGRDRPYGPALPLRLGRTLEVVPRPGGAVIRPLQLELVTVSGAPITTLRCPTTEVLGSGDDDRWHVRVHREGPSGERYVLEGWTRTEPMEDACEARVAYVDTGNIPTSWVRVPARAPRFAARGAFWWEREGRCERWAFQGDELIGRHSLREDGCTVTEDLRYTVERRSGGVVLTDMRMTSRSSCGGVGYGAAGSSERAYHRIVADEPHAWRWIEQGPEQDPVAYHPDDAGVWFKTRAACEAAAGAAR
ncbi:MAG: hypothetical protein IT385_26200 [Deltaproteobacteria bacterium]|nr:hypothetical protein [Deltaproteobacteria bacterium]